MSVRPGLTDVRDTDTMRLARLDIMLREARLFKLETLERAENERLGNVYNWEGDRYGAVR